MDPASPCSICFERDHKTISCPELSSETRHPSAPQPTGPRGQGGDDDD